MAWGCVSALDNDNLHFCVGTINAEKYIDNAKLHPAHTTNVLVPDEEGAGAGMDCQQSRPVPKREMCGALWNATKTPYLRLVCKQNGTKLHLNHLITWGLQSLNDFRVLKRNENIW